MGILDRKNLHLYPPFIALLCSRIRESELLENSLNVNRLYLEMVRALVQYLAVIRMTLLHKKGSPEAEQKLKVIVPKFSYPNSAKWLEALTVDASQLTEISASFSSEEINDIEEIDKILSNFLHAKIGCHKNIAGLLEEVRTELQESSLDCVTNFNLLEILITYADVVCVSGDRTMSRIRRANKFLSDTSIYLLNALKSLFDYKLGTLESSFYDDSGYRGFFRIHYGQAFYPILVPLEVEGRIGSVFLFKECKKDSYRQIMPLSPLLIQRDCSVTDCSGSSLNFFVGNTVTHACYRNFYCGHDLQDRELQPWFEKYRPLEESEGLLEGNEKVYYQRLYDYWSSGTSDSQEERALRIMSKVMNLSVDRLYEIEDLVKQKLGVSDSHEGNSRRDSYRQLFEELTSCNVVEALERVTLQEHARALGLGNAETLELELKTWVKRARELMDSQPSECSEELAEVLVQIAFIDFNNDILKECAECHGINIHDDPRVKSRENLFGDYLKYLKIVYDDQVVTKDERRFLEIQRKRLGLTEKEGFELEFLEEKLVEVLDQEHDQTYLMHKENFKLGGILLAKALITEEQLNHALEIQSREKGTKLGAVLYELGYVDPSELKRCLDLQEHLYFCKESHLLGSIALKFALVDQRQLNEGLRMQEALFQEKKEHRPLGEILLSKGSISQQTLDFILSIQRLTTKC